MAYTKTQAKREEEQVFEAVIPKELANLKLPDVTLINDYKLRAKRKLWLDIDVDVDVLDLERQILLWNMEDEAYLPEERDPIWLYIWNQGGYMELSNSLIDVIEASLTPIYTVNMGLCASAAADIFTSGKKRYMLKNARVMYHQGHGSLSGDAQKMADQMADYNRQLEKAKEFLLAKTKITSEDYEKYKYNDWWLTAEECLSYGVCDQIIETLDDII